ncbi:MAG: hypothetical protein M3N41_01300 [Acidobacteriota bacterium]|nr:hypothetical protein [Acidobacteriota bacterium]
MARTKENTFKESKGKVTFVMFQVEGDDETLQQGFRAMEQAFQRLGTPARVAAPHAAPTKLLAKSDKPADIQLDAEEREHELPDQPEETGAAIDGQRPNKPRNYTQPTFLADLDLSSDKESFKDYATRTDPKTDNQKYLVASRWLHESKNIDAVTIHHIYTCFQAMKWTSQKDVAQPFRTMTKKDSYYQKNGKGWKLTHVGSDAADAIGS